LLLHVDVKGDDCSPRAYGGGIEAGRFRDLRNHNGFSFETTGQLCMAGLAAGIAPFVRVPSISPHDISRALDGGVLGVIAPHIHSAREAERVVRAAKFAPLGDRSIAGGLPHLQFRTFPATETIGALKRSHDGPHHD
jgi:4-hydroxy-2-oxoheptanedioate aldolase